MTELFVSPTVERQIETALWYESHRKELIAAGNFEAALETYRTQRDFFPDQNTGKFWDRKFAVSPQSQPIEDWRLKEVTQLIDSTKTVLNIGVGQGQLEAVLQKRYPNLKYVGTDIARKTLNKVQKQYPRWKFQYAELNQLPFPKEMFDQVLVLGVLEHIRPCETFSVLKEISRVLKSGGIAIFSVPINEGLEKMLPENPDSHMRIYSVALLQFELEQVGLQLNKFLEAAAFAKGFGWKHKLNKIFHFRQPNHLIAICSKPTR